jgi:hypothetical protein
MADKQWYALKIRPGFEAVVARSLQKQGFEVFIPDQKPESPQPVHLQKHRNRNYLQCRCGPEQRNAVRAIPGVVDIIGQIDKPDCGPKVQ